jgi:hypothetical protein
MRLEPLRAVHALSAIAAAALLLHGSAASASDAARASVRAAVRRAGATYAELEQKEIERLTKELDRLLRDEKLLAPFVAHDRDKLLAVAGPAFAKLKAEGVTHWYFLDKEPARTCFLRVHAPSLHDDRVDRSTLSQAISTHQIGYGKELGKTAFALRVVKPIMRGGALVGYMELGEEIDHFFDRMKAQSGDDFGLLVDKALVDRKELARVRKEDRWDERPDVVLIESTMWDEEHIDLGAPLQSLSDDGALVHEWQEGSQSYAGGAFPVRDAQKRLVGAVFVRHRISP